MTDASALARLPRSRRMDGALLLLTVALALLGFVMVLSASAPSAQFRLSDSLYFFKKQLLWGALGFGAMAIGTVMAPDRLRPFSRLALIGVTVLLALTYIPGIGVEKLGASRWLHLGPLSLQPSELAKLALVLYLADVLARKPRSAWTLRDMRHAILPVVGLLGLVNFQPDLGTTLVLTATVFAMFLCAGTPPLFLLAWLAAGAAGAWFKIQHTAYQKERLLAFLDPWGHSRDIGFQITQSLMAIGSGGIFGTGWGQGKQKLFYLPIQHSDFIFSVLAEELGLIGSVVVVLLFLAFATRGMAIAAGARSDFARLLATGITAYIVFQAFLNIAVVTSSVPTTGIPLPLMSFGGTSLLVTLFGVGLLLAISRKPGAESGSLGPPPRS
ncbi:MAG: putative lipid II flippase FtsW [Candidatus Sericytochromatia bacterium]|nr:putative lipid II flippase FtsW [Candidatus Tanganyikabacteria bacterium]